MSLFQNKSDYFLKGEDQLDVFHLGAHGCDVLFTRYEADTAITAATNATHCKCLIVQGSVSLCLNQETRRFKTGDWFEIPRHTDYSMLYEGDCSIIEFWFDPPQPT